jgi:hypothetical protein
MASLCINDDEPDPERDGQEAALRKSETKTVETSRKREFLMTDSSPGKARVDSFLEDKRLR